MSKDDLERAKEQAKMQIEGICEMMATLEIARRDGEVKYEDELYGEDKMRELIEQDALSVEVRSDWHSPGEVDDISEFCILLCTGGPAVRIIGDLGQYNSPENALVQYQDWFTCWKDYYITNKQSNAILAYCQLYWFGE